MGQAKRRKLLDPYFGKNKTLLQLLIEKDEFFDKPQNIYLSAFMVMPLKPIVTVDAVNYDSVVVTGFDCEEDFPKYIESYKEDVFKTDFSLYNVLIITAAVGMSLIVNVDKSEVENSLKWAEYKGLRARTKDSMPKRIANYDLTGFKPCLP